MTAQFFFNGITEIVLSVGTVSWQKKEYNHLDYLKLVKTMWYLKQTVLYIHALLCGEKKKIQSSTVLRCLCRAFVSLMEGKMLRGDELVPQDAQQLSQPWYVEMSLMRYVTQ